MELKNIESVKAANQNIVKILSGGVLLWEKLYRWGKYFISDRESLGYFNTRPSDDLLSERFPDFFDFEIEETSFGTFEITAVRRTEVVIVSSTDRSAYPDDGFMDGYFYKFIN